MLGFVYDTASRLATVPAGTNTAGYGYLANSPLVEHIWFTNGTTARMTTTKSYDKPQRLQVLRSPMKEAALPRS